MFIFRQRFQCQNSALHSIPDIKYTFLSILFVFYLRQHQKILNESLQPGCLYRYYIYEFRPYLRILGSSCLQRLYESRDGRQGRLEFMADIGNEFFPYGLGTPALFYGYFHLSDFA